MKNARLALVAAGQKITCRRYTAKSKRSGNQCGLPAMRNKTVCDFHGGRSTGHKTQAGKARNRAAVTTSSRYTKEAMKDRARSM